jgi:transposase
VNKRYVVRLTALEREKLEGLVSKGMANARKIVHAQVLLKVDADGPCWIDERAAEAFSIHANTVREIRERFVFEGLEAALNRKKRERPAREPKLDGAQEARVVALACSKPPEGRVRWTLRLLAGRLVELEVVDTICHETVRKALKKTSSGPT